MFATRNALKTSIDCNPSHEFARSFAQLIVSTISRQDALSMSNHPLCSSRSAIRPCHWLSGHIGDYEAAFPASG